MSFSASQAAEQLGIGKRQLARNARELGIKPRLSSQRILKRTYYQRLYSAEQIEQIRQFREGLLQQQPVEIQHFMPRVEPKPVLETICIHCPHAREYGFVCCQCGNPVKPHAYAYVSSLAQLA